jgi:hypothetical protein
MSKIWTFINKLFHRNYCGKEVHFEFIPTDIPETKYVLDLSNVQTFSATFD